MGDSQMGPAGVAATECLGILQEQAAAYAQVAVANIGREFPSLLIHMMSKAGDVPARPADRTPVFYGSLDWHSCVEMHWLLVRLLRLASSVVPAAQIRELLEAQFTADKLAVEASFADVPTGGTSGRTAGPGRSRWYMRSPAWAMPRQAAG